MIALGAWVARLREVRRAVLPVASHIVATEPIPERIEQLGWTGGELLGDPRTLVHYSQVSPDGRIVFGRGGGAFGSAGRVVGRHFADPAAVREVEAGLRRWFPMLERRPHHARLGRAGRPCARPPAVGRRARRQRHGPLRGGLLGQRRGAERASSGRSSAAARWGSTTS